MMHSRARREVALLLAVTSLMAAGGLTSSEDGRPRYDLSDKNSFMRLVRHFIADYTDIVEDIFSAAALPAFDTAWPAARQILDEFVSSQDGEADTFDAKECAACLVYVPSSAC